MFTGSVPEELKHEHTGARGFGGKSGARPQDQAGGRIRNTAYATTGAGGGDLHIVDPGQGYLTPPDEQCRDRFSASLRNGPFRWATSRYASASGITGPICSASSPISRAIRNSCRAARAPR